MASEADLFVTIVPPSPTAGVKYQKHEIIAGSASLLFQLGIAYRFVGTNVDVGIVASVLHAFVKVAPVSEPFLNAFGDVKHLIINNSVLPLRCSHYGKR